MKKTKTILSVLLTAVMLLTMFTAVPFSVSAVDGVYHVTDSDDFLSAQNAINSHNSGTYDVYIDKSFESTYGFSVNNPVTVNFYGEGNTLTFTAREQSITIGNGGTVNLGSLTYDKTFTIKGKSNVDYNDCAGALHVWGINSTCNMYDGVTIKDRKGNNYLGGGVTVQSGTFNMYGGTIDKCGIDGGAVCYGGGVAVFGKGKFVMNGGTISNCYALSDYVHPYIRYDNEGKEVYYGGYRGNVIKTAMGGGVFVTGESTFVMNNGTITKNESTRRGGGISVSPSTQEPVNTVKSKVVINGGTISSNESNVGGGIYVGGKEFPYSDAITFNAVVSGSVEVNNTISAGNKASVRTKKSLLLTGADEPPAEGFNMNGGTVTGNTANVAGGGIEIHSVKEGATLKNVNVVNNTAKYTDGLVKNDVNDADGYFHYSENGCGGGILFTYNNQQDSIKEMAIENCTISNNTSEKNGGGVALIDAKTYSTTIKDSTIRNNESNDRGAGVYYDATSKLNMCGADIVQDNTYDNHLNNVNVLSTTNPIYVTGSLEGSKIGLSDPRLWDDNLTDARALDDGSAELLTNGYKANNPDVHPSEYFTSDHETWIVDKTELKQNTKTVHRYKSDSVSFKTDIYIRDGEVKRFTFLGYPTQSPVYKLPLVLKAKTFNTGVADNVDMIYNELSTRYRENSQYSDFVDNTNSFSFTTTDGINVVVTKNTNNVTVVSTLDSMSTTLTASVSDQTSFAADGEIALFATSGSALNTGNVYENTTTTKSFAVYNKYESMYSRVFKNTVIYDEIGRVVGKYTGSTLSLTKDNNAVQTSITGGDEVRLIRRKTPLKFHDNKDKVGKGDDKLFRVYNAKNPADYAKITEDGAAHSLNNKGGVDEFYSIPKFAEDDYVFAGWYYHTDGDKDGNIPFEFDSEIPANVTDVYAHWIKVGTVSKAEGDDKELPSGMNNTYSGFGLFGVQIRPEAQFDQNMGEYYYGGLRFVTSIKNSLLEDIDNLSEKTVGDNQNKVEYGYVTAGEKTVEKFLEKTSQSGNGYKIQYNDKNVNGVDTTQKQPYKDNYRYVKNVDCTAKDFSGKSNIVDHRKFGDYRLATMVIIYDDKEHPAANAEDMEARIVARAYIRYYDANGLLRTFYNDYGEYGGTNVYGGCCTSFKTASEAHADNEHTVR